MVHTVEVHQKNIRYILNADGRDGRIFSLLVMPPFSHARVVGTLHWPGQFISEQRLRHYLLGGEKKENDSMGIKVLIEMLQLHFPL
jgi:hypothetical protein